MSNTLREQVQLFAAQEHVNNGLNQSKTAEALGISRGCLRQILAEYAGSAGRGLNTAVLQKFQKGQNYNK